VTGPSALAIGVDIGGTKVAAAVVDAAGRVLRHEQRRTPAARPDSIRDVVVDLVGELTRSHPVAAVGVGAGFLWSGANFAEGAFIGTVLLIGIAVNDSILLADRYRQLRSLRPRTQPALLIRLSVRERLRPMWTTTLTTTASLLPLIVFPSAGEFWLGLAVTVTGGLIASTLLAPVATVAMVSLRK